LNWEEPFGLVVTEAMACGTPVITNKRGSMPELIINEQTGFLVDTLEEMRQRLDDVDSIDRSRCRKHVEDNFAVQQMVDGYLELAESLIKK
jgi:glycosyltransferase involved in cell wall biosynthesis